MKQASPEMKESKASCRLSFIHVGDIYGLQIDDEVPEREHFSPPTLNIVTSGKKHDGIRTLDLTFFEDTKLGYGIRLLSNPAFYFHEPSGNILLDCREVDSEYLLYERGIFDKYFHWETCDCVAKLPTHLAASWKNAKWILLHSAYDYDNITIVLSLVRDAGIKLRRIEDIYLSSDSKLMGVCNAFHMRPEDVLLGIERCSGSSDSTLPELKVNTKSKPHPAVLPATATKVHALRLHGEQRKHMLVEKWLDDISLPESEDKALEVPEVASHSSRSFPGPQLPPSKLTRNQIRCKPDAMTRDLVDLSELQLVLNELEEEQNANTSKAAKTREQGHLLDFPILSTQNFQFGTCPKVAPNSLACLNNGVIPNIRFNKGKDALDLDFIYGPKLPVDTSKTKGRKPGELGSRSTMPDKSPIRGLGSSTTFSAPIVIESPEALLVIPIDLIVSGHIGGRLTPPPQIGNCRSGTSPAENFKSTNARLSKPQAQKPRKFSAGLPTPPFEEHYQAGAEEFKAAPYKGQGYFYNGLRTPPASELYEGEIIDEALGLKMPTKEQARVASQRYFMMQIDEKHEAMANKACNICHGKIPGCRKCAILTEQGVGKDEEEEKDEDEE